MNMISSYGDYFDNTGDADILMTIMALKAMILIITVMKIVRISWLK